MDDLSEFPSENKGNFDFSKIFPKSIIPERREIDSLQFKFERECVLLLMWNILLQSDKNKSFKMKYIAIFLSKYADNESQIKPNTLSKFNSNLNQLSELRLPFKYHFSIEHIQFYSSVMDEFLYENKIEWEPHKLEKFAQELFEKNEEYIRNTYDKKALKVEVKQKSNQVDKNKLEGDASFNISIPNEFKLPLQQYFLLFKEYVTVSKRVNIQVEIKENDNGISIKCLNDNRFEVGVWLQEYIDFFRDNFKNDNPKIENINTHEDVRPIEVDILILKLKNQVSQLMTNLRIMKLEYSILRKEKKYLSRQNDFLQGLVLNLSKREFSIFNHQTTVSMDINSINIYGGNQQFAEKIINGSEFLNASDSGLVNFINENAKNDTQKVELVEALETFKDESKSEQEKSTAKELWKKFLESSVTETTKESIKYIAPLLWAWLAS